MIASRFLRLESVPFSEEDDGIILSSAETKASHLSFSPSRKRRGQSIRNNPVLKWALLTLTIVGASFVAADGLLTPAVSILSAIEGIMLPVPTLGANSVVGISCAIVVVLFLAQRFGTSKIAFIFSPIVFLWLLSLMIVGIYNMITYDATVWRAWNPAYAIRFLRDGGDLGVLSGILLCITGVEILFADMGHFTPNAIRLAFSVFVFPCLCCAYIGQGAYLLRHPENISTVFYSSIPGAQGGPIYWIIFTLATGATIIASQAIITGMFSIVNQAIQLDCFPPVGIKHTSQKAYGQIYIPSVNFALMVGVLICIGGFSTSSSITQAYGNAVSAVLLITTILLTVNMYVVYGLSWILPAGFLAIFGTLDLFWWVSTMKKIPHGAWFPLCVGVVVASLMLVWKYVTLRRKRFEHVNQISLANVFPIVGEEVNIERVEEQKETKEVHMLSIQDAKPVRDSAQELFSSPVQRVPGLALYYTSIPNLPAKVPASFAKFLQHFPVMQEAFVFIHIRVSKVPRIAEEERLSLRPYANHPSFFKAIARFGFMDIVKIDEQFEQNVALQVQAYLPDLAAEKLLPITHIVAQPLFRAETDESTGLISRSKHIFWKVLLQEVWSPIASMFPDKKKYILPEDRTIVVGSIVSI